MSHSIHSQRPGHQVNLRILPDGKHLAPAADQDIWGNVLKYMTVPHENWLPKFVDRIPSNGMVVDCGAFIGDHAQQFCSLGFETIAIEPFLDAFVCLCYNSPKSRNILGSAGDGRPCKLVYDCPGTNHGMRSVIHSDDGLPSILVDELGLKRLDFLKIDVEGFEPFVLDGAMDSISTFKPLMFVEANQEALQRQGWNTAMLEARIRGLGCKMEMVGGHPRWDWLCSFD